jgi:hypothetical protein
MDPKELAAGMTLAQKQFIAQIMRERVELLKENAELRETVVKLTQS